MNKENIIKYAPEADCIDAMKIWKLPENKLDMFSEICKNENYFVQLKKDGYWYQYEKTNNHSYLFSRNISKSTGILTEKIDNVPHIKAALDVFPPNTILIGEIYYPYKTSKDVTKIMGCLPETAIERQKDNKIHYYIYDIIKCNGINIQNKGAMLRYELLKYLWNKYNLGQYDFLELAESVTFEIEEYTNNALTRGEEGVVLKRKNAPYTPGKRPAWDTIKVKKKDNIDVIYIGNCAPTKEYEGKELASWEYNISSEGNRLQGKYEELIHLGYNAIPVTKDYYLGYPSAIKLGCYNEEGEIVEIGTVSSGLSEDLKKLFAKEEKKLYNNIVIEIECMEKNNKDYTLRHGFIKQLRLDKNPKDCKLNEIFI